jgi:uncharacterized radical SAM superfamily Fe-S cluster-containing enzyme
MVINNVEYIVRKTNKALIDFERMMGKSVAKIDDTYTDNMTLFYCFLKAANKDTFKFTFDEFLYMLDENEENIKVFNGFTETLASTIIEDNTKKKIV